MIAQGQGPEGGPCTSLHGKGLVKHYDKGIFSVMPSMFVDLANDCRVDLLERCLRHGFDNKADILLNKKGCFIIKEDSIIGIILNTMSASMHITLKYVSLRIS